MAYSRSRVWFALLVGAARGEDATLELAACRISATDGEQALSSSCCLTACGVNVSTLAEELVELRAELQSTKAALQSLQGSCNLLNGVEYPPLAITVNVSNAAGWGNPDRVFLGQEVSALAWHSDGGAAGSYVTGDLGTDFGGFVAYQLQVNALNYGPGFGDLGGEHYTLHGSFDGSDGSWVMVFDENHKGPCGADSFCALSNPAPYRYYRVMQHVASSGDWQSGIRLRGNSPRCRRDQPGSV